MQTSRAKESLVSFARLAGLLVVLNLTVVHVACERKLPQADGSGPRQGSAGTDGSANSTNSEDRDADSDDDSEMGAAEEEEAAEPSPANVGLITDAEFCARAAAIQREVHGDGANGWAEFKKLAESYREARHARFRASTDIVFPDDILVVARRGVWPPANLDRVLAEAESVELTGVWTSLDAILASGPVYQPFDPAVPVLETDLTSAAVIATRSLAQASAALLRISSQNGDASGTARSLERSLGLARLAGGRCLLVDASLGVAAAVIPVEEVLRLASEQALPPDAIEPMLVAIRSFQSPSMRHVIEMERAWYLATSTAHTQTVDPSRPNADVARTLINGAFDDAVRFSAQPFAPQANAVDPTKRLEMFVVNAFAEGNEATQPAFDASLEGARSMLLLICRSAKKSEAMASGAVCALLLERHRLAHGSYPESLAAIDALLDPITGMAFGYRVLSEEQAARERMPYLLYSVGLDKTDNGGTEQPGKEGLMAGDPAAAGFDVRVLSPRPTGDER